MSDVVLGQSGPERPAGERGPVVGAERERPGGHAAGGEGGVDDGARLDRAAADVKDPGNDLARAAVDRGVQVAPAVRSSAVA
jgi:hypothetical protein